MKKKEHIPIENHRLHNLLWIVALLLFYFTRIFTTVAPAQPLQNPTSPSVSETPDTPMTLHDCLLYARDHARSNQMEQLSLSMSRIDQQNRGLAFLPYVSFGSGASLSFGRGIDPETNNYATKQTLNNSYGLSMSLPLFDGLVKVNTYRAYKMMTLQQRKQTEITADATSLNVIRAYYNLVYYEQLVDQVKSQLQSHRENLRKIQRQEALGIVAGADVDEMKATVANSEYQLVNQENLLASAQLELKAVMNYPIDSPLTVFTQIRLDSDPLHNAPLLPHEIEDYVHLLPKAQKARLALRQSHYQLKAARGDYSPTLSLSAGISTSYHKTLNFNYETTPFNRQWHDNMGQNISLNLSIPIFDRLGAINSHRRAKLSYKRQQIAYEETIFNLEKEMQQARMELEGARREYLAAESRLNAVTTAHRANQRKFELGTLSALELYTSSTNLASAQAAVTGKQIQYLIKRIEMDYYLGRPFIRN